MLNHFVKKKPLKLTLFFIAIAVTGAGYYIPIKAFAEDNVDTAMLTLFITVIVLSLGAFIVDRISRKKAK